LFYGIRKDSYHIVHNY